MTDRRSLRELYSICLNDTRQECVVYKELDVICDELDVLEVFMSCVRHDGDDVDFHDVTVAEYSTEYWESLMSFMIIEL